MFKKLMEKLFKTYTDEEQTKLNLIHVSNAISVKHQLNDK